MNSRSLTLMTIFGTRPEVIKLNPILSTINRNEYIKSIVVSTSQHRKMIDDLLDLFSIKVDHDLNIMQENQSLIDISIRALSGLEPLFKAYHPDMVIVQGDTTTAFIGALASFYHKIPVGHVEAGLRSFDKMNPYPEEINRKFISIVSDLHFAPTIQNAENLINEGIDSSKIFITGNTVIDSLLYTSNLNRDKLKDYLPMERLNSHRIILVTAHRRENWGNPLENLCHALKDIVKNFQDVAIIYPVHPNPNVRKTAFNILSNIDRIHLLDPLPYEPFVEAMNKCYFIITDSGGIQEEGPSLKKPILVFRKVTERPEGVLAGGVKVVGLNRENLVNEAFRLLNNPFAYKKMIADYNPYGDGHAAQRIVQAILYYFHITPRPLDFKPQEISPH